ncbi:4928_t:CDS:2 [Diversispora eburnea]|uniref:4928_t:CDS:1 n=1 Tax=Diversispora eburnea TaxID=1213867 RepID=A0A9N9C0H2_9GLOM|nr:4928_t:CDS:2 [Diversispora eburnea]
MKNYFAPKIVPGFENLHSDIVIIPGFKGSRLFNTVTKNAGWLELHTPFLPYSKENIDLPLEIEKNEEHCLVPDGIFARVLWMKFYDTLIKHLEDLEIKWNQDLQKSFDEEKTNSKSPLRFHKFSYDWRRSNEATHSNGGLITLSTLHQAPHLIAGAIFAGTPFHGAPGILRDLRFGSDTLFNKKIQDDAAFITFRPVLGFLPWNRIAFRDIDTNEDVYVDYFDIKEWLKNDWVNIIHEDNLRYLELGSKEKRIEYLNRTLENTKEFHETLKFRKDFDYPPLVTLASGKLPTNGGYMVQRDDDKTKILYENPIVVNGDGAVPIESTKLPEGIPHKTIFSERSHGELLEDLETVGEALLFLFSKNN